MRHRITKAIAFAASVSLLAACGAGGGGDSDSNGTITLRFQSLAWQKESIAVNKALVQEWNKTHPRIHVKYVQGDWGSVHDKLLTSFEGGDPPDIIHYEAAAGQVFAEGGYYADLDNLLSDDFKKSIPQDIWETVQYDDRGTVGVPFLLESRLPIANKTMLDEAGIPIPTPDDPWTWDEFQ
ncbi:MAG: ABC transporter substrate-binding protein, partial [Nocardioidaceae bacterium]